MGHGSSITHYDPIAGKQNGYRGDQLYLFEYLSIFIEGALLLFNGGMSVMSMESEVIFNLNH